MEPVGLKRGNEEEGGVRAEEGLRNYQGHSEVESGENRGRKGRNYNFAGSTKKRGHARVKRRP
jgi:hypothetical protein